METKVCSKCGKELPVSMFHKHPHTRDKLQPQCKECVKESRIKRTAAKSSLGQKIHSGGAEDKLHKVFTSKILAPFTPRELMMELKARGYEGELLYVEVIKKEHRISLSRLE